MENTMIEALKNDYDELIKLLKESGEISLLISVEDNYKKILVISAASYFEKSITDIIINYVKLRTNSDDKLTSFVSNKALNRQYHSLFSWPANNANQFFSFFGDAAKKEARKLLDEGNLADSEKAFMTIGRERNKIVHQNYIEVRIDSTFEELYAQYQLACDFVEFTEQLLSTKKTRR